MKPSFLRSCLLLIVWPLLPACDQIFDKGAAKNAEAAEKRAAAGDFPGAIRLYETALDGTPKAADIHYQLALIYADKLKSPVGALHHFARYLELAPKGAHAAEAREYQKEGERKLVADLTKGTPVNQEDAVWMKNQLLVLNKALAEEHAKRLAPGSPPPVMKKGEQAQRPIPAGARTYLVQQGDTLAAIARHFYKSSARSKDIQDANFYPMAGTPKLKPGMTLAIP